MRGNLYGVVVFVVCMSFSAVVFAATPALTPIQRLGQKLYFDKNLSLTGQQSCASCHDPGFGFVDPDSGDPVSAGESGLLFGNRNAPSAAYAAFSPAFRFDEVSGLYIGGQFWDGREPNLAGQAGGPFRNPVEMAMPDKKSVVSKLKQDPGYYLLFRQAFSTEDGPFKLALVPTWNNQAVLATYDLMTKAIGEFEKTQLFNKFNSKFDYYLAGEESLSSEEERGLKLFNKKAKCALCHITEESIAPDGGDMPPLLTDFTYDNLGIPVNQREHDLHGSTELDLGLGGVVHDPAQNGKFKVMSLRNIALTAPYGHNGYFPNLESIVHFYNTRDTLACGSVTATGIIPATTEDLTNVTPVDGSGIPGYPGSDTCWPAPEVNENVNHAELGDLGLTLKQEAKIIAFLNTLSDRGDTPTVFAQENFPPSP